MLHFSLLHLYGTNEMNRHLEQRQAGDGRPEAQYHSLIQFFQREACFPPFQELFTLRTFQPFDAPQIRQLSQRQGPEKSWARAPAVMVKSGSGILFPNFTPEISSI